MFYPEEAINENLVCPFCEKIFDSPTMLACGDSICKQHLTDIIAILPCNSEHFKCPSCKEDHDLPKNNIFPENKVISRMMKKQPIEIILSAAVRDFKTKLNECKLEADELGFMLLNNGNDFVNKYCQQLRTDVHLAIEHKIEEIHKISDGMLNKINTFETERLNYIGNERL